MEKLIGKLKTSALVTLILGILSITWLVLDYFVLKDISIWDNLDIGFEFILLIVSLIAFLIFHLSVFISLFYMFRVIVKFKSETKKGKDTKIEKNEIVNSELDK